MISIKQIKANQNNAIKGGVKTQEGKEIVKYNAITHGLSSNLYNEKLEENLIEEYKISGTLEKMLVKNTCIAKARYEKGVELEQKLFQNIILPFKYEKVYNSQEEYEKYLEENQKHIDFINSNILGPKEPDYILKKTNGNKFDYDLEKLQYLIEIIGKYNCQNETRLNKNIIGLLQTIK